ncbi:2074_t:CDS:2 [Scutellospora calospora]|uniref:2074_t:CDS:1 n=1 Tax=Scutellospora calospora TaxID=85575 RepID=A0ACA9K9J4_9GLOM|nr:2074_t:CDS:2 [Scutellospora calospora]
MEKVVGSVPTVITNTIEITEGLTAFSSNNDIAKNAISAVGSVGEAVKPFIPLITAITVVISEIIVIYENAQYNKRICNSLMDRVGAAEQAVKSLQRRQAENEKHFRNSEYYKNFVRFVDVMKRIKGFIKDVSELQGFKKFFHANSIKEKFDSLVKEFENVMAELHFTITVADEEQRRLDHQALEQDIHDMTKFLEQIQGGIVDSTNTINTVLQEVLIMKGQIDSITDISKVNLPNSGSIKAVEINPDELLDPDVKTDTDRRGNKPNYIYKKNFKFQEVACKPIIIPNDDSAKSSRGKREKINFGAASPEIQEIQQELKSIIISAWQDDPGLRASLQQIFLQLSKLASKNKKTMSSPSLLPSKSIDLDGTLQKPISVSDEGGLELPDLDVTTPISTSTRTLEEEDASILEELSRKYSTEQLIEYLKGQKQVKETNEIIIKQKLLKTHNLEFSNCMLIEKIRNWQVPYAIYFMIFLPEDWSYDHYASWIDKNMNKAMINSIFYRTLETMKNDQNISQGIHNVIQGLLKSKKSDVDYTDSRAIKKVKKEFEKSDTILKELKDTNASVTKNGTASTEKSNTNLKVLEETLLKFFKSRSNFSLSSASEAVLQAVAELLLQENEIPELSELCLVIDNNKPKRDR